MELKYRVLAVFPNPFYCDPGQYPVAVWRDETTLAQQQLEELQAQPEQLRAILQHNGLAGTGSFSDAEALKIYADYKKLRAIDLEPAGQGYRFELRVSEGKEQGFVVTGLVDRDGALLVKERRPSFLSCPICLPAETRIAMPGGAVPIAELRVGDTVWTADPGGERRPATVLKTLRVPVPAGHRMVHVQLSDGRALQASPGHPTADGRRMGDLRVGDLMDGGRITQVSEDAEPESATYDLLPSGPTGGYWANGILIGSTLVAGQKRD